MKKSAIVLFFALLTVSAFAQNIQDGVNHLYAERYQSAKAAFEKLRSSNPNNIEATYWLGQVHIANNEVPAARALYEQALAANGNAPLVLVGMGQVELNEGKTAEARQRFEAALTASKGKKGDDANVLNAIGRANVQAKEGDAAYAIQKLEQAAQLAQNNPDVLLNLGNAYRKAHDGGRAITNYRKATILNPNFARAFYRMAGIYQTQKNWDVVVENLEKAIAADNKFAPAYLDLYYYYLLYPKDFNKAEGYANQYVSVADPSVQNDFLKAQTAYVLKKHDEAISIAQNILQKAGTNVNPRVYRVIAYSYVDKGDTAAARPYVDSLFARANDEDLVGEDFMLKADVIGKSDPDQLIGIYRTAALRDSVLANQVKFLYEGIARLKAAGKREFEADLRSLSYQLRQDAKIEVNPTELISYIAVPYYQAGAYKKADSVSKVYSSVMPDSIYGYLWSARALAKMDTTMESAVPAYEALLAAAEKDKVKFKPYGTEASAQLASYHVNLKGNREKGAEYLRKALEFDPENANFKRNLEILTKPAPSRPAQAPAKKSTGATSTKAKTTGS